MNLQEMENGGLLICLDHGYLLSIMPWEKRHGQ